MRAGRPIRLLAAVVLAALAAPPAGAWPRPEVHGAVGRSFLIAGDVGEGGFVFGAAAMWPSGRRWALGVEATAEDMGSDLETIYAPGTDFDLGTTEEMHRAIYGAAARAEWRPPAWRRWEPVVSATLGGYEVRDDVRGDKVASEGAVGAGLGAGVRRAVARHVTLGAEARLRRVFDDRAKGWLAAGLTVGWR